MQGKSLWIFLLGVQLHYAINHYFFRIVGSEKPCIYSVPNKKQSYDQYDSGMSRTNATSYANIIYFNGDIGTEYRFEVTVFAQDSSGSDTESETFTLIAV